MLGVSRQIVVGDVALLRAGGAQIDAAPRGYQRHPAEKGYTAILACVHSTEDEMRTELYTVVDQGGIVVDVAVELSLIHISCRIPCTGSWCICVHLPGQGW